MPKVTFIPNNRVIEVTEGSSILQAAWQAGLEIESACGGKGTCGKCRVQVHPVGKIPDDSVSKKFLSPGERAEGWVLACKYLVKEDITVRLKIKKDAYKRKMELKQVGNININLGIKKLKLKLPRPSIADQTPDWDRLQEALPCEVQFNLRIAASLPNILRQSDFEVTAVLVQDSLLAVEPGDTVESCYGLSIDIGTTTVVVYLVDLYSGKTIASGAMTNPQYVFGADVISRIMYAGNGLRQVRQLQTSLVKGLNKIINNICKNNDISKDQIYQVTMVGNTAMSHLFLGIDPTYLASAPFIPVFRHEVQVRAEDLGIDILVSAPVVVLPNIAGFVGSDTVSVMLATQIDSIAGFALVLDIGTNGEMILAGSNRILTCSTAAGPAFEGAKIKYGMRAADGAIESVLITDDVQVNVIGGVRPNGICGSGLLDAVAQMLLAGIIDKTGRLVSRQQEIEQLPVSIRGRLRRKKSGNEFVLVWANHTAIGEDIVLTQRDIRELQLAKGAIRAGIEVLLAEMGIQYEQLENILLAGAFGNYIKKESVLEIGLLPKLPAEKIIMIGNAAGEGARRALLSNEERTRASKLAERTEHIELSTIKLFQDKFIQALSF